MKRILFIVAIAIAAGFINSAVGQIIWYNNVQYRITADNSPYGYYRVVVHHYDTTDVVIPDSVPYNGHKYQVVGVQKFTPNTGSLRHYRKVDYSQSLYSYGECGFVTTDSIEVDTLILPPNFASLNFSRIQNSGSTIPSKGVHRIFCSPGGQLLTNHQKHNLFGQELLEIDLSPYTDTLLPFWFSGCSFLQKAILPSTLKVFEEKMFDGDSSLMELTIPENLEVIKQNAFGNFRFDNLNIGSKVRKLQPGFCARWYNLRRIDVSPENRFFKSDEDGVLFSAQERTIMRYPMGKEEKTYVVPFHVDTIGMQAFALQTPRDNNYDDRDTFSDAFWGYVLDEYNIPYQNEAPLQEVVIHPNVQVIDKDAFMASSIRTLSGGEDSKEHQDFSFSNVRHIETGAFVGSMLCSVVLPASLLTIGSNKSVLYGFWHKDDLPYYMNQAYGFYYYIFHKYGGRSWTDLPWQIRWYEEQKNPGLHTYMVGGGHVFQSCKHLKSVDFSKCRRLTYLGGYTFADCSALQSIDLSPCDSLRAIHDRMFSRDSALTYVHLPYRVDTIDPWAFYDCVSLTHIVCPAPIPIPLHWSVFDGVNRQNCTLAVPDAFIPLYQAAPIWQDFNIVGNGLKGIAVMSSDRSMGVARGSAGLHIGDSTVISATPLFGYEFVSWSDGSTDNPRVIHVSKDSTLIANFQYIEYHIDARPNDTTLGTVTGGGYYHFHDTVILAANIPGYSRFTGWSDGFRYPIRDLVVTQDCTLIANFEHYHVGPNTVRVTVQSEDPAKGYAIGGGTYDLGDTASVAGIANAGYVFKGWDDGNINNPRHVPLTQDTLFVALFRLETDTTDTMVTPRYPLKAIPYDSTMGTVSGSGRYEEGTVVEITATPFDGYRIKGWNVEVTVSPTITFTMSDRPATVIAYFEPVDDALPATPADPADTDPDHTPYNILGQPVDETYHGIVIQNGQKRVQ